MTPPVTFRIWAQKMGRRYCTEAASDCVVQWLLYDTVRDIILHVPFRQRNVAETAQLTQC